MMESIFAGVGLGVSAYFGFSFISGFLSAAFGPTAKKLPPGEYRWDGYEYVPVKRSL